MLYFCELVDGRVIEESFYREGDTAEEVRQLLENVQYGDGEWRITEVKENAE